MGSASRKVRIKHLARGITNQLTLEATLLQIKDRLMRREVYYLIKPHLPFRSEYPPHVSTPHEREAERVPMTPTTVDTTTKDYFDPIHGIG